MSTAARAQPEGREDADKSLEYILKDFSDACDQLTKIQEVEKDDPKTRSFLIFCISADLPVYDPSNNQTLQVAFKDTRYGYFVVKGATENIGKAMINLINHGRWLGSVKEKMEIPVDKTIAIAEIIHPDVLIDENTITIFEMKPRSLGEYQMSIYDFGPLEISQVFNLAVIIHRIIKYYQKYILNTNEWYEVFIVNHQEPIYMNIVQKDLTKMRENGFDNVLDNTTNIARKNPSVAIKMCCPEVYKKIISIVHIFLRGDKYNYGYLENPRQIDRYDFIGL